MGKAVIDPSMGLRCEQFVVYRRSTGSEYVRGCAERATVIDNRQPNLPRAYCQAHAPTPKNFAALAPLRAHQELTESMHIALKNGNHQRVAALRAERRALNVTEDDLLRDPLFPRAPESQIPETAT